MASVTDTTSVKAQTDRFLKILLTQLQNQNPIDPMKPEQFAAQLAQFSQLEQQVTTNEKLDKLITASAAPQFSPLSYLNTTVDYYSQEAPVQDGNATWSYVAAGADAISIRIEDATGHTVHTTTGDISSGSHVFTYPSTLGDGTKLKMVITATKSDGTAVESTINARAKITAVNTVDGTTILEANGFFLNASDVTRVAATPTTPTV